MAVVREAEAVQVRDADVGAPVLHPRVRPYLAAQLLIHCAWVPGFCELVWHGAAKDEPPGNAVGASRPRLDRHADVEAASDPSVARCNSARIPIAKPQMVPDKRLDRSPVVPEHPAELLRRCQMRCLLDDVRVLPEGRRISDGPPVV